MRRLDEATLTALAALICGDGGSPYRSAREIQAFFRRAGAERPAGGASRVDWALDRLEECNEDWTGRLAPHALERVILRIAQPCEYRGSREAFRAALETLNTILAGEGLRVTLCGREPQLDEALPGDQREGGGDAPDFTRWTGDTVLAQVLQVRWVEAHACLQAGAYLSATIMLGSILEGVLCRIVSRHPATVARCPTTPRDGQGKPRPLREWTLRDLVEVACQCGWLRRETVRFGHLQEDYHALIHPYAEWQRGQRPDEGTCRVARQVLLGVLEELLLARDE